MVSSFEKTSLFILMTILMQDVVLLQKNFAQSYTEIIRQSQRELNGNMIIRYPNQDDNTRKQTRYSNLSPFMCANSTKLGVGRSLTKPTSVHKLRPGDIDVIGAMGDSLIAGNGAMENWAWGTIIEYRGVSWAAGGQGTWRQFLTLPNILKEYNKNLTGFSTGTGEFLSSNSQLNVAFPVSADSDALRQARILVKKIKQDERIDLINDWKMITLFFGANDLCSAQCFNKEGSSGLQHARKLMLALDYLQEHLPRTFVNLIPVLDATVSVRIKRTVMCRFLHTLFCSCFHQGRDVDHMTVFAKLAKQYQRAEDELVNSGRYDKKEDFTVVLQPFMKLFNANLDPKHRYDEVIDISYITHDCFHFSQKGHALVANMLWNNLLEPVGAKSIKALSGILDEFKCPTEAAPYFFTSKNSRNYLRTGWQNV